MAFLEGGVNSLGGASVQELAEQYEALLTKVMADNPDAQIFIQSVLPISDSKESGLTKTMLVLRHMLVLRQTAALGSL